MMHLIGTILGLFAAWWIYNDAKKLGHSNAVSIIWAVAAFLFLIIAVPLYLLFGRKPAMKTSQKQDGVIDIEGEVIINAINCPMCGRKIEDTHKVCPFCGFSIKRTCPNCGMEVDREQAACPSCRTAIDSK